MLFFTGTFILGISKSFRNIKEFHLTIFSEEETFLQGFSNCDSGKSTGREQEHETRALFTAKCNSRKIFLRPRQPPQVLHTIYFSLPGFRKQFFLWKYLKGFGVSPPGWTRKKHIRRQCYYVIESFSYKVFLLKYEATFCHTPKTGIHVHPCKAEPAAHVACWYAQGSHWSL